MSPPRPRLSRLSPPPPWRRAGCPARLPRPTPSRRSRQRQAPPRRLAPTARTTCSGLLREPPERRERMAPRGLRARMAQPELPEPQRLRMAARELLALQGLRMARRSPQLRRARRQPRAYQQQQAPPEPRAPPPLLAPQPLATRPLPRRQLALLPFPPAPALPLRRPGRRCRRPSAIRPRLWPGRRWTRHLDLDSQPRPPGRQSRRPSAIRPRLWPDRRWTLRLRPA